MSRAARTAAAKAGSATTDRHFAGTKAFGTD